MLNRAISEFKSGQLDAAKADYDSALKINPGNYQSYYGLAEIAWQQKDKYTAMKNYQLYLSNAPDNPVETKYVTDRLQQLKSGSN
jgi:Tfp pilus assembly protein PilF